MLSVNEREAIVKLDAELYAAAAWEGVHIVVVQSEPDYRGIEWLPSELVEVKDDDFI